MKKIPTIDEMLSEIPKDDECLQTPEGRDKAYDAAVAASVRLLVDAHNEAVAEHELHCFDLKNAVKLGTITNINGWRVTIQVNDQLTQQEVLQMAGRQFCTTPDGLLDAEKRATGTFGVYPSIDTIEVGFDGLAKFSAFAPLSDVNQGIPGAVAGDTVWVKKAVSQ